MDQVRQILQYEEDAEHRDGTVWITTSQMGWPPVESVGDRDGGEDIYETMYHPNDVDLHVKPVEY